MEPGSSLPRSQQPANSAYSESDEPSPCPPIIQGDQKVKSTGAQRLFYHSVFLYDLY